jgi:hypothetical protein
LTKKGTTNFSNIEIINNTGLKSKITGKGTNTFLNSTKPLIESRRKKDSNADMYNPVLTTSKKISSNILPKVVDKSQIVKVKTIKKDDIDIEKEIYYSNKQNLTGNQNLNKNNIFNIAVFNPEILKFSDFKGIRNRNNIAEESSSIKESFEDKIKNLEKFKNEEMIGGLNFNKIMMTSIQKKLNKEIDNRKVSMDIKPLEVDVDNLIKGGRTRTKGISKNLFCILNFFI